VATVLCKVGPYCTCLQFDGTAVIVAPDIPEILIYSEFVQLESTLKNDTKFYSADKSG
jgi:hypothetical protein